MRKTQYEKLFKLFVAGIDEQRRELRRPFKQNGYYYATDAHSMVYMPVENCPNLGFAEQYRPKASGAIPSGKQISIEIGIDHLKKHLAPIMIDEVKGNLKKHTCEECNGSGTVDFEYSGTKNTYTIISDCPVCLGDGEFEETYEENTGKKIPDKNQIYVFCGVNYMYEQLDRLIKAADIIGTKTMIKRYGMTETASLFDMGGNISILVMPCILGDNKSAIKIP